MKCWVIPVSLDCEVRIIVLYYGNVKSRDDAVSSGSLFPDNQFIIGLEHLTNARGVLLEFQRPVFKTPG
jgi:hypothetical protein